MLAATDILGTQGRIAARLEGRYEERPEQLAMADGVSRAIRNGHHLVVEAGTGVGKSFAYLVPAILAATGELPIDKKAIPLRPRSSDEEKDEKPPLPRVIVSTHTISLQEQLIQKDLPLL